MSSPATNLLARAAEKAAEAALHVECVAEARDEGRAWSLRELALRASLAFVAQLEAIRLTLAADSTQHYSTGMAPPPRWVRLELFGHSVRYGNMYEVEVVGRTFLRLVEPSIVCDGELVRGEVVKEFHPNAVYAVSDIGEDAVVDTLRRHAGLHRWRDGSWHADREAIVFEVDAAALEERDASFVPADHDDGCPF